MNSLAKAEKAAEDANIRNVKAAAINTILEKWKDATAPMGVLSDGKTIAKNWDVTASIENGDINSCTVQPVAAGTYSTPSVTKTDEGDHWKYEIKLSIKDTDVTATKAVAAGG